MIHFNPHTLYTIEELKKLLSGVVEFPTFLDRLGLRKNRVFKHAVWGWEIIESSHKAESFSETKGATVGMSQIGVVGSGSRTNRSGNVGVRKLTAADLDL